MPKIQASDDFVTSYIECAVWSSTDDNGHPLDGLGLDLTKRAEKEMRDDCDAFVALCAEQGEPLNESDAQAGHDFWLTRNGHGAGFWDRGLPNGEALSALAKLFGSCDLYVSRKRIHIA